MLKSRLSLLVAVQLKVFSLNYNTNCLDYYSRHDHKVQFSSIQFWVHSLRLHSTASIARSIHPLKLRERNEMIVKLFGDLPLLSIGSWTTCLYESLVTIDRSLIVNGIQRIYIYDVLLRYLPGNSFKFTINLDGKIIQALKYYINTLLGWVRTITFSRAYAIVICQRNHKNIQFKCQHQIKWPKCLDWNETRLWSRHSHADHVQSIDWSSSDGALDIIVHCSIWYCCDGPTNNSKHYLAHRHCVSLHSSPLPVKTDMHKLPNLSN